MAIDADDYGALDTFVLGFLEAEGAGKWFIYRQGLRSSVPSQARRVAHCLLAPKAWFLGRRLISP